MKKLLTIALLLCTGLSLSSFAPSHDVHPMAAANAFTLPFPITGIAFGRPGAGAPAGNFIYYEVSGSGDVPSSVSLYDNRTSPRIYLGSYPFTTSSSSTYVATGMKATTTITAFQLQVNSSYPNGYLLQVIGD